MINVTDQLGNTVRLTHKPRRIVSTVPSQTELLYHLGLGNDIAGITTFCIHPAAAVRHQQKIGGTKQLDLELIKSLQPDLVIANKEENEQAQVMELMALYPTYVSNPVNLAGALEMINTIGVLTATHPQAAQLTATIQHRFEQLNSDTFSGLRVAYLIWRKPYMLAGKNTFIDDMLQRCGFTNAFNHERYPQVTAEMLVAAQPDVILLSSEPYPFKQKHVDELQQILPDAMIKLVDGELFSWYGSRLLHSPGYFIGLINSIAAR